MHEEVIFRTHGFHFGKAVAEISRSVSKVHFASSTITLRPQFVHINCSYSSKEQVLGCQIFNFTFGKCYEPNIIEQNPNCYLKLKI